MPLVDLDRVSSSDLRALADGPVPIGLVALGALEQHGPHLPVNTDTLIGEHLLRAVAELVARPVVAAPVLPVGLSDHHRGFAGTATVGARFVDDYLDAMAAMFADCGVAQMFVFSPHGGNFGLIRDSCTRSTAAPARFGYHDLPRYLSVMRAAAAEAGLEVPVVDAHAGGLETSQVKWLQGDRSIVVPDDLEGLVDAEPDWLERVLADGVRAVSESGVLGRPQGASSAVGRNIFAALEAELADWIGALVDAPERAENRISQGFEGA